MQRHLERLDPAVLGLLPAQLGSRWVVRLEETPLPIPRAHTVSYMLKGPPAGHAPGADRKQAARDRRAITGAAVERLVMAYTTKRWATDLLARVDHDAAHAIGVRGHGSWHRPTRHRHDPVSTASMLSLAYNTRRMITESPDTPAQRELAVLVVGEVLDGTHDVVAELDRLVDALGGAYDRLSR